MVCREKATTETAIVCLNIEIVFVVFEHCQSNWHKYSFCLTLLVNKSCECVTLCI